jgi:nitrate/nitrite transporter NarK
VGALAPEFRRQFGLSPSATALLVSTPVLLGSIGRIPLGFLADRFGARKVIGALVFFVAAAAAVLPAATTFETLLAAAFFVGFAGAVFAPGVSYVVGRYPPERQGAALGIFGVGNIGQSFAVFLAPVVAEAFGVPWVFRGTAALLAVWGIAFVVLSADAQSTGEPPTLAAMGRVLRREPLAWLLSAFYFLTFGGFVAFAVYLRTLLQDDFALAPADAGFRAAGFVVLATLLRPVGGWLADRIGGARVLSVVLLGLAPFALLLTWRAMLPFTVGALGCAALFGVGNGAVFKLVPQYFPREAGIVSGLVGALGGLGGFFPPLLLGFFLQLVGATWPAFVLLALTAFVLWRLNAKFLLSRDDERARTLPPEFARPAEQIRAGAWATLWTGLLAASIVVGSRNLQNFDSALVVYTFGALFSTWGVAYHYCVWIEKPPTRVYWRRGWELFWKLGVVKGAAWFVLAVWDHVVAQNFIRHRSRLRWWMHQLIFWGCVLAAAITFPLAFGWVHFRSAPGDQMTYVTYVFGFPVGTLPLGTVVAWLTFHGLDVSACLVLGGVGLSLWRRMRDPGARAVQDFGRDLFPLVLLVAISVTGLALTVSASWMRGASYQFLALLHALVVVLALLYLGFGKFFHVFQRPAQLGVRLYREEGARGEGAACASCGDRFASRMHVEDLAAVLRDLGFDYRTEGRAGTWQELCPACKRRALARAQLRVRGEGATIDG